MIVRFGGKPRFKFFAFGNFYWVLSGAKNLTFYNIGFCCLLRFGQLRRDNRMNQEKWKLHSFGHQKTLEESYYQLSWSMQVWDVRIDSYSVMVREKNNCRIKNCSMGI
jgi:hypothetical protein